MVTALEHDGLSFVVYLVPLASALQLRRFALCFCSAYRGLSYLKEKGDRISLMSEVSSKINVGHDICSFHKASSTAK